jgi:hypothetical protein
MGLLDFQPKADIWTGIAVGVAVLVAPVVIPVVAVAARPVLKSAIKNGLVLYEKGRELMAEVMETAEDIAAEARSEANVQLAAAAAEVGQATAEEHESKRSKRGGK